MKTLLAFPLFLIASQAQAGYVDGYLEPREVCTTQMVWVEAVGAQGLEEIEAFDLLPPATFWDREFMGPYQGPLPRHTVPFTPDNAPDAITPIPAAGWLFLGAVFLALAFLFRPVRTEPDSD
jgi:hypothetical protein